MCIGRFRFAGIWSDGEASWWDWSASGDERLSGGQAGRVGADRGPGEEHVTQLGSGPWPPGEVGDDDDVLVGHGDNIVGLIDLRPRGALGPSQLAA